jgi:hypothetical protein
MRQSDGRCFLALVCSIVLTLAASACRTPRTDQTAMNTEDTGQYEVLAQSQPEPQVYEIRVRVHNLDASERVARDLVHQKASLSPRAVRVVIFGPADRVDGVPRRTIKWPEELDYRQQ